jgi:hypothetical protein
MRRIYNLWTLHLMVHKTHVRLCGGKWTVCALRNGVTQQIHIFRMPFSLFYNCWTTVTNFDHISLPSLGSSQTIIGELQEHKMPKILVIIELGNPRVVCKIQIKFKNKFNRCNQEAKTELRRATCCFQLLYNYLSIFGCHWPTCLDCSGPILLHLLCR